MPSSNADGEAWLQDCLAQHALDAGDPEVTELVDKADEVKELLLGAFDGAPVVEIAGSYAKGTMVRDSYDLDLVCYFANDDDTAGGTLEEIYDSVKGALSQDYKVSEKKSAIRIKSPKDREAQDFHIDVVPGRFTPEGDDVFLHQTNGGKERLKTNLRKHVSHVRDSSQTDVIQLIKVWKTAFNLDVKTFPLELAVISALDGFDGTKLEERVREVLRVFKGESSDLVVEDPANPTGNDLAPIFGETQREALRAAAELALDLAAESGWSSVFETPKESPEAVTKAPSLQEVGSVIPLGPVGHMEALRWPVALRGSVRLQCEGTTPSGKRISLSSGKGVQMAGTELVFRATTDIPPGFEVWWQVVNTGAHASQADGLRGEIFRSKDAGNPLRNEESTLYTGNHWIECFIVNQGVVVARSGRFLVPIYNPKSRTLPRFGRRRRVG